MNSDNERGRRYIASLWRSDEDVRLADFRELVKDSITDDWARDTVTQVYSLAASGECDHQIGNIFDTQMLLTSIDENPSLLPVVEADIEKLVSRFEAWGSSFRGTWVHVRSRISQRASRGHAA